MLVLHPNHLLLLEQESLVAPHKQVALEEPGPCFPSATAWEVRPLMAWVEGVGRDLQPVSQLLYHGDFS
jgi:hypothetical protein